MAKEKASDETHKHGAIKETSQSASPQVSQMPKPVPKKTTVMKIGKYSLLEELGEGEFGHVYKAKSGTKTSEYVVVKILKSQYSKQDYARLQQEAKILQKLRHKSLPHFIETGITKKGDAFEFTPYLVMEFIPGETLREVRNKGISADMALRWSYELAEGLRYLHSQEVIHRDLKPSNIQITWTQHGRSVRILDFGIAILRSSRDNEIIGSLRYMSPEQLQGQKIGKASDIYSLGLILYEMLNGSYPYDVQGEPDFAQWLEIHCQHEARPITNKTVPAAVADIVMQCLLKEPQDRPALEKILEIMGAEVTGIGIPSYIGILGVRGSGKTCYLTSIYHEAEVPPETRNILEDKYLDLYEKGVLPSATALSAYRLNFQITTPNQCYDIVTKDYGGELLAGRREERLQQEANIDRELLQEKREEVYEFFRSARGILIMIETKPAQQELKDIVNYRNEIYSLIEQLATVRDGVRRINVPIAFVLTKWDRIGNIPDDLQKLDARKERQRALEYIKSTDWVGQLYEKIKIICPYLEVFPVFSFIGDKPSRDHIKPFNICAPLLWITDAGDECLFQRCRKFHQEHPKDYHEVVANYWRLLSVEKICNQKIRKQAENTLCQLSQEYLKFVNQQVKQRRADLRWCAGLYQQFLNTKGVRTEEKEQGEKLLKNYRQQLTKRRYRAFTWITIFLALLSYGLYEFWSYYQIERAIVTFHQGQSSPNDLLQKIYAYRQHKSISPARLFIEPKISQEAQEKILERFEKESVVYEQWLKERLPVATASEEKFGKNDLRLVQEKLRMVEEQTRKYDERIQKLQALQEMQEKWLELFRMELASFKLMPVSEKLHELQQNRLGWVTWGNSLDNVRKSLVEAEEILKDKESLLGRFTAIERSLEGVVEEAEKELAPAQKYCGELTTLQNKVQNYLKRYSNAPFTQDIQQVANTLPQPMTALQRKLAILTKARSIRQSYQDAMLAARRENIIPNDSDPEEYLKDKKERILKNIAACREIQDALKVNVLPCPEAKQWQENCEKAIAELDMYHRRCNYLLAVSSIKQKSGQIAEIPSSDAGPERLAEEIKLAGQILSQIRNWPATEDDFIFEDYRKFTELKARHQQELLEKKERFQRQKVWMEELQSKCDNHLNNWQESLRLNKLYRTLVQTGEELSKAVQESQYLSTKYKDRLTSLQQEVRRMRSEDRRDYQGIEEEVRQYRFLNALARIDEYSKSAKHGMVMADELTRYTQGFSCLVETTISLQPSQNFKDSIGSSPDFLLTVTAETAKISTSDQKEWAMGQTLALRQKNVTSEVVMGKISLTMDFLHFYALSIQVAEIDWIKNDNYGKFEKEVTRLLNNERVSYYHDCVQKGVRDGDITLKFEPVLSPQVTLPAFKD